MRAPNQLSIGLLNSSLKTLNEQFDELKNSWRDQHCQQFEKEYIEPLPPLFKRATFSVNELNHLLKKIHNELMEEER